MTEHYWNQDPAAPAPPTWQQTPRAVPPQFGRPGSAAPPARNGSPGSPTPPAPVPSAAPAPTGTRHPAPAPQPSRPPGPRVRGRVRVLRHWRLLLAAVLPCLVLAGVGWWAWPGRPAPLPARLVAGTVQAELLTPDGVSRLAGVTLVQGPWSDEPHAPVTVSPANCAVAAGPATRSVYGREWTAFLSATYQDAGNSGAYTVNQVIGVFPDNAKAGAALRALATGLAGCPSSTRTDQAGRTTTWAYTAYPPTPAAVVWTATQNAGTGWACHHQARLKGAALVEVAVCAAGNGQPTASKLADALTGKVTA
ncbi:sensor domain-containing protein [Kitasatospora sp. NPDC059571]|uniref:sensor domain-containing protein n=1 Tax=Kitasatospora sp. NPDC059571 TaxID=3346871 RepID=UPI00368B9C88